MVKTVEQCLPPRRRSLSSYPQKLLNRTGAARPVALRSEAERCASVDTVLDRLPNVPAVPGCNKRDHWRETAGRLSPLPSVSAPATSVRSESDRVSRSRVAYARGGRKAVLSGLVRLNCWSGLLCAGIIQVSRRWFRCVGAVCSLLVQAGDLWLGQRSLNLSRRSADLVSAPLFLRVQNHTSVTDGPNTHYRLE